MTYQQSPDIEESRVGERVVLYHRSDRKAVVLNPTGTLIWPQLSRPRSAAQLLEHLKEVFPEVPPEQLEADLQLYLGELRDQRVIVECLNT
jgi:hypothetical protein